MKIGADVTVSAKLTKGTNDDPEKNLVVYTITYGFNGIKNISFGDTTIPAILQPIIEKVLESSLENYSGSTNIPIPKQAIGGISLASLELAVKDGHLLAQVGLNV